jgi:hypothetical protein
VQRLLKFERLAEDFETLVQDLKLGDVRLARENETVSRADKRPWASYYDAETKALAEALYAQDFNLLGYPREIA